MASLPACKSVVSAHIGVAKVCGPAQDTVRAVQYRRLSPHSLPAALRPAASCPGSSRRRGPALRRPGICSTSSSSSERLRKQTPPQRKANGQQWRLRSGSGEGGSALSRRDGPARGCERLGGEEAGAFGAMLRRTGKVGVYGRIGNVALASFGALKAKSLTGRPRAAEGGGKQLARMLPYVVLATAVAALAHPPTFSWFGKKYYAPALGGIMLSIGVQLSLSDFALVLKKPLPLLLGYAGQYVAKPLLGLAAVALFRMPPEYAAGMLLTASVAGAQLSSYAAFLGDGDVAAAVVLTSLTTISSVAATPLLTHLLIGALVPVDALAMAKSILQVVVCPVLAGLLLNTYARAFVDRVRTYMPLLAMACTALCIGSPLAMNARSLLSLQGLLLLAPVLAFHAAAFAAGYWIPRCSPWRQDEKTARTLSLCTGMQSSTLAMLLASQFLGASHAVPPACSVVVMAAMGLGLGSFWGKGHCLRDWASLPWAEGEHPDLRYA